MDRPQETDRWDTFAIAAILLLALALRLYRLDAPLWYDEVLTLTNFVRLPWPNLLSDFSSLNNHMAYSVEAKLAVGLLGESAFAMRLPAVLFGVGSIALIWPMVRQAAGRGPTLVAMGLAAISYHHIWFSQNARGYTELLFFTSLATLIFVRAVARPSWGLCICYAVALALAMYTHLSAGFFIASHGVVGIYLLLRRQAGMQLAYGGVMGAVLTVLLYAPVIPQVIPAMNQVSDGKTSSTMAEWTNPLRMLGEIGASFGPLGPIAPLLIAGALLVIVLGAIRLWRGAPVLTAIYVLSIPIALVMLMVLSFRIWPRYFFVDINIIFVFAALGCSVFTNWLKRWFGERAGAPLFAAAALAMVVVSLVLLPKNYLHPKQDFAGAVARFEAERRPGDRLAAISLAAEPLKSYFAPEVAVIESDADLQRLLAETPNIFVITAFDNHVETGQEQLLAVIEQRAKAVIEFDGTLGGGEVRMFRLRGKGARQADAAQAVCGNRTDDGCG
ncbi:hypothetical protein GRI89_14435 [Altererythrobacter salegens]|uniref:Glycosyltransferase RgtA/B/C/D-like domain-containing protein n=1 Tax=Croceibacterium salegens TaxID=1737568 RepID=A0A6I4T0E5_9SPHN|nr:glycosyltransferase family 39 protein [Croceibacterium salegens]MXO60737.1 hypothetical protein [Croceibacterium salegens]